MPADRIAKGTRVAVLGRGAGIVRKVENARRRLPGFGHRHELPPLVHVRFDDGTRGRFPLADVELERDLPAELDDELELLRRLELIRASCPEAAHLDVEIAGVRARVDAFERELAGDEAPR